MHVPDSTKPVLFKTSRFFHLYRYGLPLLPLGALAALAFNMAPEVRSQTALLVPLMLTLLAWILFFSAKLRPGSITEEGIIFRESGTDLFLAWLDIDWATELWMNPPALVVRVKRGVPGAPLWFLMLPHRQRTMGWRVQPMSEYVAGRVKSTRAEHPDRALEYTRWPSRVALNLTVQGALILSVVAALGLSVWLHFDAIFRERPPAPGTRI